MSVRSWKWTALTAMLALGTVGCHWDADTAGKPRAERNDGEIGSTTATKEGTGDPKVGSGRGQVGTDAPESSKAESAPPSSKEVHESGKNDK